MTTSSEYFVHRTREYTAVSTGISTGAGCPPFPTLCAGPRVGALWRPALAGAEHFGGVDGLEKELIRQGVNIVTEEDFFRLVIHSHDLKNLAGMNAPLMEMDHKERSQVDR
jgi:hypothetical protein